ncbi:MAG: hypothetical protein B7Y16_08085 [Methylotenera sp. 24-45-7]|jgi:cytoskeleton protein RodZ|nr:MAG: hypothetical protein B7Y34_01570 [Methylophilales bacterium 16-45-9]OYZ39790.1 MAG: hypothetical protein B7Y16_08085 [Methylotenera sp. 24-45-7]OZA09570.1 MAG: hypothetical protein B7X97_02120 [Methylotenera sp. 17-45-7]OZA50914.1 MAG: hypothetical protein B7X73_06720 [Methylophilales bacterium 39-45-7]HQS38043.1 DUF4115 domain-containing protein [Methylotenera sp.]
MADEQVTSELNTNDALQPPVQNLGATLQAARLEKKLSQQDVSNSLRYSVKQIDALENNVFDSLPDAMMTRGFIRSYAKYLELDAEPLLAAYRTSLGDDPEKVISVKSSMRPVALTKESQPWLKYILASIVVLLFLLAWMAYVEYMPTQDATVEPGAQLSPVQTYAETTPESLNPSLEPLPEAALPAAERLSENDTNPVMADNAVTQANQTDANQANTSQVNTNQVNTVAEPSARSLSVAPVVPATPAAAISASASSQAVGPAKNISFTFSGQSWVRVMDMTGKVIYEKLSHSGETETIQAVPPVNIVVGNASDTKLNFSGQEVDLAAKTKNNVARVTLE